MVIVSALLAIAIPTLSNSSSNTLQASREMVKGQLRQARSHAISKRTPTALIAATENSGESLKAHSISMIEVKREDGAYVTISEDSGNPRLIQRFSKLPGNARLVSAAKIGSNKATLLDNEQTLQINHQGNILECHFIIFGANGEILSPPPGIAVHVAIATRRGAGEIEAFELIHINRLTGATRSVSP
jgi:type II secretory pathway pseudopilin PulG